MSLRDDTTYEFPSEQAVPIVGFWEGDPNEFGRSPFPASTWDERALEHIEKHLQEEASAGAAYESFADHGDPAIKYLAALLAADERRHHQILEGIAKSIRSEINGSDNTEGVPEAKVLTAVQRNELLDETHRLLAIENADALALKELRRELRPARDETLWPLLAEIMALDTDKHIRILRAIERLLRRGRRS